MESNVLIANDLFNQFRPMIEKAAWHNVKKYKCLELEDIRSQAYLVFVEALQTYDPSKASFSTYLYNRLKTVNDYSKEVFRTNITEMPLQFISDNKGDNSNFNNRNTKNIYENNRTGNKVPECNIIDNKYELSLECIEKLETALTDLSDDAQEVLDFIISREWETPGLRWCRLPTIYTITRYFKFWKGWKQSKTKKAFTEIMVWWFNY